MRAALDCERAWQAEAGEDGRLSEPDVASFERHAASCEICRREITALARLREVARRLPVPTSTPIERRRLRNQLLRRAHQLSMRAPSSMSRARSRIATLALAGVALAALVLWFRAATPAPLTESVAGVPSFQIGVSDGAQWSTLERSSTLRLAVQQGTFRLDVRKLRAGQRFLLELPDGELEVQGTRFVVHVDRGHTRQVSVSEGRVALRLHEQAPLVLSAGRSWSATTVSVRDEPHARDGGPMPAQPATPARRSKPAQPLALHRSAPGVPASAADGGAPAGGADFASAMSAFSAGDYGRAELLFFRFTQTHPTDARTEDATFLTAVARSRRGDASGARALAGEYLRRYPQGLRRLEAERLTQQR